MLTIIFLLCVQSVNFHWWLSDDHAPPPRMCESIMARGRGPWSKEPIENFQFLDKNATIWHQMF